MGDIDRDVNNEDPMDIGVVVSPASRPSASICSVGPCDQRRGGEGSPQFYVVPNPPVKSLQDVFEEMLADPKRFFDMDAVYAAAKNSMPDAVLKDGDQ